MGKDLAQGCPSRHSGGHGSARVQDSFDEELDLGGQEALRGSWKYSWCCEEVAERCGSAVARSPKGMPHRRRRRGLATHARPTAEPRVAASGEFVQGITSYTAGLDPVAEPVGLGDRGCRLLRDLREQILFEPEGRPGWTRIRGCSATSGDL